jgi:hypothetical protein
LIFVIVIGLLCWSGFEGESVVNHTRSGPPLRKKILLVTTVVGNGLFVIAKIPIRSFGYAIGLLSARAPPSYSSSPNIPSAQRFCRDEKGRQLRSMTIRKL